MSSCHLNGFGASSLLCAMSSSSFTETYELHVKGVVTGVQDATSTTNAAWERRLGVWEARLAAWEKRLLEKEANLKKQEARWTPPPVPSFLPPGRLLCEVCEKGPCSRRSPCFTPTGLLLHRHHHCSKCHQQFKETGTKGSGKGGQTCD